MRRSRPDLLRLARWLALSVCLGVGLAPEGQAQLPPATASLDVGLNGNLVQQSASFGTISVANSLGTAFATATLGSVSTSATSGINPPQIEDSFADSSVSYYFEISGPPASAVPILITASGSTTAQPGTGAAAIGGLAGLTIVTVGGGNLSFGACAGTCSPGSSPNFSTTVSTTAQSNTPINVFLSSRSVSYANPTAITATSSVNAPVIIDPSYPNAGQYTIIQSTAPVAAANNLGAPCCPPATPDTLPSAQANSPRPAFASPAGPCASCGDPINAATGNSFQTESDFRGAPNTGLALTRYYNSQDTTSSAFGAAWHSTWHRSLNLSTAGMAIVTRADGREDTFLFNDTFWQANPDVTSVLSPIPAKGAQTGWQLVTPATRSRFTH
jgi:uncharacterized protein DUF6531